MIDAETIWVTVDCNSICLMLCLCYCMFSVHPHSKNVQKIFVIVCCNLILFNSIEMAFVFLS